MEITRDKILKHLKQFKMKLKLFNQKTLPRNRGGVKATESYVHVTSSTGIININKLAAAKMGLSAGDQVVFHQDEDQPSEWFFGKGKREWISYAVK
jgi:hypothetical protein